MPRIGGASVRSQRTEPRAGASGPVACSMASVFGFTDCTDQFEDGSRLVAAQIDGGAVRGGFLRALVCGSRVPLPSTAGQRSLKTRRTEFNPAGGRQRVEGLENAGSGERAQPGSPPPRPELSLSVPQFNPEAHWRFAARNRTNPEGSHASPAAAPYKTARRGRDHPL
jgi:hypothetical protein